MKKETVTLSSLNNETTKRNKSSQEPKNCKKYWNIQTRKSPKKRQTNQSNKQSKIHQKPLKLTKIFQNLHRSLIQQTPPNPIKHFKPPRPLVLLP